MAETQVGPTIDVRAVVFADLRRFLPKGHDGRFELALDAGTTVATVLDRVGIPAAEEMTIGLNGEQGRLDSPLRDGDEVLLFSPMEGG